MIHSPRFTAILDACVLYPAPLRDLLLHLASAGLYKPKWTERIQEEWQRSLLLNRPDIKPEQLKRTADAMTAAFPDGNIEDYEELIGSLIMPDPDDRHVLAAAVRCQADVIVTVNLKDFPNGYLGQFNIEAQHPDYLISNLIDLNPATALGAFQLQVSYLRNPPMAVEEVLGILEKVGLVQTCAKLRLLS
jgi:hypothetical protein